MPPRHIVCISAECSGVAQRGGLGSVLWGLSDALRAGGNQVTLVLPYYAEIKHEVKLAATLPVNYGGSVQNVSIFLASHSGIPLYLIHSDQFFRGEYADVYIDSGRLKRGYFEDDARRFAFFSAAAAALLLYLKTNGAAIDVIHCHDWHTSLALLLVRIDPELKTLRDSKLIFTVHNLEYQGTRPWAARGNLESFCDWFPGFENPGEEVLKGILDPHADIPCINPMRAGLWAADAVTTVSPTYAEEICKPDSPALDFLGGRGLEADFQRLKASGKLFGIVNGIDYDYYDPEKLKLPFNEPDWKKRDLNRAFFYQNIAAIVADMQKTKSFAGPAESELLKKAPLWVIREKSGRPLFVLVSRLTGQKMNLLLNSDSGRAVLEEILSRELDLVILGKGDLAEKVAQIVAKGDNALLFNGFDDALEKLLYSAGDVMLMPSDFEPCGTSQMKAMRYGCPPIAAGVGGLIDTVKHGINGYCYAGQSPSEKRSSLLAQIDSILLLMKNDPAAISALRKNAMQARFSWPAAAEEYLKIFE